MTAAPPPPHVLLDYRTDREKCFALKKWVMPYTASVLWFCLGFSMYTQYLRLWCIRLTFSPQDFVFHRITAVLQKSSTSCRGLRLKEWPCDISEVSFDQKLTLGYFAFGNGLDFGFFPFCIMRACVLPQEIFKNIVPMGACQSACVLYFYSTRWKALSKAHWSLQQASFL